MANEPRAYPASLPKGFDTMRETLDSINGRLLCVHIPVGVVDPEGVYQIETYLRNMGFPALERYQWCWDWVVNSGAWKGTLPKRISSYMFKTHTVQMEPETLSQIGNIAMKHISDNTTHYIDFTDNIDWKDGAFGDFGSCFWHSRTYAKKMIQEARLYAMRYWSDKTVDEIAKAMMAGMRELADEGSVVSRYRDVEVNKEGLRSYGRVWLIPDYLGEMSAILFNTYPPGLGTITSARILATVSGLSYRQIEADTSQDELWINAGKCYLVGSSETIAEAEKNGKVTIDLLKLRIMPCDACGHIGHTTTLPTREIHYHNRQSSCSLELCDDCASAYKRCPSCGHYVPMETMSNVTKTTFSIGLGRGVFDGFYLGNLVETWGVCGYCMGEIRLCHVCNRHYQCHIDIGWNPTRGLESMEVNALGWFNKTCPDCYIKSIGIQPVREFMNQMYYLINEKGELVNEPQNEEVV